MFTRSPTSEPKKLEPLKNNSGPGLNSAAQAQRRGAIGEPGAKSVIGNDLKIIGQGLKIIGEKGKVTGTVAAERVIVRGQISGVIRGVTVTLQASSRVEGDIHHMSLAIEQGAEFDGRCRRPSDASELNLNLEAPGGQPRPN